MNPETRTQCLEYLRALWILARRQDDAASLYNTAVIQSGGGASAELEAASAELLRTAKDLELSHAALAPVPDEAVPLYAAWHQTWYEYRCWCEAQAAVAMAGMNGRVTVATMTEVRRLLDASEESRRRAEKLDYHFHLPSGVALVS